jgi:cell division protein FtsB
MIRRIINFILEFLGFRVRSETEKELEQKAESLKDTIKDIEEKIKNLEPDDKSLDEELRYWDKENGK